MKDGDLDGFAPSVLDQTGLVTSPFVAIETNPWIHRGVLRCRPDESCAGYPFHLTPEGGLLKAGSELTSGL